MIAPYREHDATPGAQRCRLCLLPRAFPGIVVDGEGVCNLCREHRVRPPAGEPALLEILSSLKGRTYDVLVGISGGKDSCYVAYLAKKKYGLRVLGVLYDFPFMRDLARENVRNVCRTLGIELEVVKTRKNLEYRLLRDHLHAMAGTGTTWGQCLFCHYGIDAVLYGLAERKGIPFILGGVTNYELWNPGKRMGFLKKRMAKLSLPAKARFAYFQLKAYRHLVAQRREFPLPGNSCLRAYSPPTWPGRGPRLIKVFDYVPWKKDVVERTLQTEACWKKPDAALSWRYDCMLEPLLDFTYLREFGISTVGVYLSNQIRDGLISRDDALEILSRSESQTRLEMSLHEVCEFLRLPAKDEGLFLDGGCPSCRD